MNPNQTNHAFNSDMFFISTEMIKCRELTPTDKYLCTMIGYHEGATGCTKSNKELAEEIGVTPKTIALSLKKLESLNFIVRQKSESGERVIQSLFQPTKGGEK